MRIQYLSCPKCGGEIQAADLNSVNYCSYCGAPLYIDDGVSRSVRTTIIRDEARLREAENASRRLDLEEQRLRQERELFEAEKQRETLRRQQESREHIADAAVSAVGGILKGIMAMLGILFIAIIGLGYLVSPVDLLSGVIIDDIIICYLCIKAIKHIRAGR